MDKDIWYVVYDDEYELLMLEEALNAYNYFGEKTPIHIVVNELKYPVAERIRRRLQYYPTDNIDVTIHIAQEILTDEEFDLITKVKQGFDFPGFGWVVQQFLKLSTYRKSNAEFSVIFDSKNIPIRENAIERVNDAHIFTPANGEKNLEFFYLFTKLLLDSKILDLSANNKNFKLHGAPSTPFIFKNSELKNMHNDLDVLRLIFCDIKYIDRGIMYHTRVTDAARIHPCEIRLYYAYTKYNREVFENKNSYYPNNYFVNRYFEKSKDDATLLPWILSDNLFDWWEKDHNALLPGPIEYIDYITVHRFVMNELKDFPNNVELFKKFIRKTVRISKDY